MENNSEGFQRANFGNWTMTVQEATGVFKASGIPRSERTIKRYCKNVTLMCRKFDFDTTRRWMVDPNSVNDVITEFKEIEERKQEIQAGRPPNDMSGQDMSDQDTSGQDMPRPEEGRAQTDSEELNRLKDQVKTLEAESDGLKINDAANKQVIQILKEERKEFLHAIEEKSHQIGTLEAQLRLEAPKEEETSVPEVIHTTHTEEDN